MKNPYNDLTPEEQKKLKHSVIQGEQMIFLDEDAYSFTNNHRSIAHTCLEVSPEQLIDVAKHLVANEPCHKTAVQQAYELICESHLFARNVSHFNRMIRYDFASEQIHNLVEGSPTDEDGHPIRKKLLENLYVELGRTKSQVEKDFRSWIKHDARLTDFKEAIKTARKGKEVSFESENPNPWVELYYDGRKAYVIIPTKTEPSTKSPRVAEPGEHITAPYWDTNDIWWPEADIAQIEHIESCYFSSKNKSHFTTKYAAKRCLNAFVKYLNLQVHLKPRQESTPVIRPKSGETGQFVSNADKGSQRDVDGKYKA